MPRGKSSALSQNAPELPHGSESGAGRLVHVARGIACREHLAIRKAECVIAGVDVGYYVSFVLVQFAGLGVEVVSLAQTRRSRLEFPERREFPFPRAPQAACLGRRRWIADTDRRSFRLGPSPVTPRTAIFFTSLLVIGVQCVQPVNLVVLLAVRGGVAQDEKRVELLQATRPSSRLPSSAARPESGWDGSARSRRSACAIESRPALRRCGGHPSRGH